MCVWVSIPIETNHTLDGQKSCTTWDGLNVAELMGHVLFQLVHEWSTVPNLNWTQWFLKYYQTLFSVFIFVFWDGIHHDSPGWHVKVHEYTCKGSTFVPYENCTFSNPGNAGFDALPPTSAVAVASEAPTGLPRDGGRQMVGGLCQVSAEADRGITWTRDDPGALVWGERLFLFFCFDKWQVANILDSEIGIRDVYVDTK